MKGVTFDSPAPGVVVAQPARGFRYTSDAMWLAGFALATGPAPERALDLGTGSGVVALLLAAAGARVVGIDSRPEWGALWAETLSRSAVAPRVELRRASVLDPMERGFDLVTCNPPFFAAGSGPVAPDPWKAAARTESTATLAQFVHTGLGALSPAGRLCLVLPAERESHALDAAAGVGHAVRRVRVGRRRVLVCLEPGAGVDVDPETLAQDDPQVRAWVDRVAPGYR